MKYSVSILFHNPLPLAPKNVPQPTGHSDQHLNRLVVEKRVRLFDDGVIEAILSVDVHQTL